MPRRVAASTSMLPTPTPCLDITLSAGQDAMALADSGTVRAMTAAIGSGAMMRSTSRASSERDKERTRAPAWASRSTPAAANWGAVTKMVVMTIGCGCAKNEMERSPQRLWRRARPVAPWPQAGGGPRCIAPQIAHGAVERLHRAPSGSIEPDAGLPDQRTPLAVFGADEVGELPGGSPHRRAPLGEQFVLHVRGLQHLLHLGVDALDDGLWRACGRDEAGPGDGFETGIAGFGHGRHGGEFGHAVHALRRTHGQGAHALARKLRNGGRSVGEIEFHLVAEQVRHCRPGALVRNVEHLEVRAPLEHFAREVA